MRPTIKGFSNADVRIANKQSLLMLLYNNRSGMTRQNISQSMSLSLPTVNLLLSQLEEDGLLVHHSGDTSFGGRIPELIFFNNEAQFFFGVDISASSIKVLLLNLGGEVAASEEIEESFSDTPEYWRGVGEYMRRLLRQAGIDSAKVSGAGLAIPGVVRKNESRVDFAATLGLKNWHYDDLGGKLGFPLLLVENEANAAGFAEVWLRGIDDAIYLSITKGLGGAVVLGGRILDGFQNRSGEFGHMILYPGGRKCFCGKNGCFEAYCSIQSLVSMVDGGGLPEFFRYKDEREPLGQRWENYLRDLAIGLSNLSIEWDLPIIVGGPISDYLEEDFPRLERMVEQLIPFEITKPLLQRSELGSFGSARGVALMLISSVIEKPYAISTVPVGRAGQAAARVGRP